MKRLAVSLLLVPFLATASTNVSFKMELNGKKYAGQYQLKDGEFESKQEDGVEINGDLLVEGDKVIVDIEIVKDDEMVASPLFVASLGHKAKITIKDQDKNTLLKFTIIARNTDEKEHEKE